MDLVFRLNRPTVGPVLLLPKHSLIAKTSAQVCPPAMLSPESSGLQYVKSPTDSLALKTFTMLTEVSRDTVILYFNMTSS